MLLAVSGILFWYGWEKGSSASLMLGSFGLLLMSLILFQDGLLDLNLTTYTTTNSWFVLSFAWAGLIGSIGGFAISALKAFNPNMIPA